MKQFRLLICLAACLLLATACVSQAVSPLTRNEATLLPGATAGVHDAVAADGAGDTITATLYYRYYDLPMLASETREISVRRDETAELAIARALLEGPQATGVGLTALFPSATKVTGVFVRDDILFIALSRALMEDGVPSDWRQQPDWVEEAPLMRRLTLASLVASITETCAYRGVQVLLGDGADAMRLENAYFLNGTQGPSEPQRRDETLLLTPGNTLRYALTCWQQRAYENLYLLLASQQSERPALRVCEDTLNAGRAPIDFSLSSGTVGAYGAFSVVCADVVMGDASGATTVWQSYPVRMVRENGLWRVPFDTLAKWAAR